MGTVTSQQVRNFVELVQKMRVHQRRYFQYRMREDMEKSKELERKVDKFLEEALSKQEKLL